MMRLSLCIVVVLIAGCQQQPIGKVSGRITFAGKPVTNARIIFQKDDGWALSATLDGNGRFTVKTHDADGLPPGKYRIAIRPTAAVKDSESLVSNETPPPRADLPEKFHSHATSALSAEVKENSNPDFAFDLAKDSH